MKPVSLESTIQCKAWLNSKMLGEVHAYEVGDKLREGCRRRAGIIVLVGGTSSWPLNLPDDGGGVPIIIITFIL